MQPHNDARTEHGNTEHTELYVFLKVSSLELLFRNCSYGHLLLPSRGACKYKRDVNLSHVLLVRILALTLIIINHSLASTVWE